MALDHVTLVRIRAGLPLLPVNYIKETSFDSAMGTTATIKQRRVDVYLPSLEAKQHWTEVAKASGMSLSKYISNLVELSMEDQTLGTDRQSLLEVNEQLHHQLKDADDRIRLLEALRDKLDGELRTYRMNPFLDKDFRGMRQLDRELVRLLKTRTSQGQHATLPAEHILRELGVKPTETEAVRGINAQLDAFVDYGLVEYTASGFRWCG